MVIELIVTADDFGYSPCRDDVIIHCYQTGIVTGTSLLVNGSSAASAVEKGSSVGLCMGLHFNLSEGVPVSNPSSIPSLVCKDCIFRGKEGFAQAERDHLISMEDVAKEFRAQIEQFRQLTGYFPPYFDGHQHIHMIPRLALPLAQIAREYGIRKTRFSSENMDEIGWMNTNPRKSSRQTIYHNALQSIPIYEQYGIVGGNGIGTSLGSSSMSIQRIVDTCLRYPQSLHQTCILEFMTHPGTLEKNPTQWGCGTGCDEFSQSSDREHEWKVLTDPLLRTLLSEHGIQLCSYETAHFQCSEASMEKRIVMISSKPVPSMYSLMEQGYSIQIINRSDGFERMNLDALLQSVQSDVISIVSIGDDCILCDLDVTHYHNFDFTSK